ncbi:MAG: leucine-rich repeat domain-containing protein [Clostridia bacterium]|nr:leucine-rich repeat domain-containing protein [Clostridia bacterium]
MDNSNGFVIKNGMLVEYNGTESRIVIPANVQRICDNVFQDNINIVSVEITEGVNCIDVGAFNRCRNIAEIKLPDSLTKIGMGAFARCSSLKKIKIPENVKKIGCSAFLDCISLSTVDYNAKKCKNISSDGNYDFYTYSDYGNFYDDIEPVFSGCTSLKTVNIGPDVSYIPSELFHSTTYLDRVNVLGTTKLSVGFKAFDNHIDLNKILHCEAGKEIVFEPLKNYKFPAIHVEEGINVIHKDFGLGEVEEIIHDKGLIKVRFICYARHAIKYFRYPEAFYLEKLEFLD